MNIKIFKKYPAILAGAADIAVILAARFGVHVTADQLAGIVSIATAILAGYTHKVTRKPKAKPDGVPAPSRD